MTQPRRITVAPNGARLQKADHPGLPVTAAEIAHTARMCQLAGADALHLHVRDGDGQHSLDADLYRDAIAAVARAAPGMDIQITTEAAGRFDVPAQLELLANLKPAAASISVREIARSPDLVRDVYATALAQGTRVQHILYGGTCIAQLCSWLDDGIVQSQMRDAILVLGQYAPAQTGTPADLPDLLAHTTAARLNMTVCAFGPKEQQCLLAAAEMGCDLRVGFENNRTAPDGTVWQDNAAAVAALKHACDQQNKVASA
ncbi:MAG: 3-keto-5-aminohexanoate cleavage protein [Pseudomonadota bacterium]